MSIFDKKEKDPVPVPEIEVHGDEVTVEKNEDEQQPRKVKLPKTKWF